MNLYLDKTAHIKPFLGINAGAYALGYVTYGVPVNTDTVTVNGTVFTKAASGGAAAFSTIAELTALINALANITAASDGSIITITYDSVGTAGNAVTLTRAGTGTLAVSGATLTGGAAADTSKDTLLDLLNGQATGILDSIFNVSTFAYHTVTDEIVENVKDEVFVKDYPVISVTSIKQGRLETLYTQDAAYIIKQSSVILDGSTNGGAGYDGDKITYVAGYKTYAQTHGSGAYSGQTETMPEELKLAALILLAGLFNQRANLGVSQYSVQGKTVVLRNAIELSELEGIIIRNRKNRHYAA
jgi:hypothetical protein